MHSNDTTISPSDFYSTESRTLSKDVAFQQLNLATLARGLRTVILAITESHIADCLIYAYVGAAVLRALGVHDAQPVAGSALWRVGSGDGDVIAHAMELHGKMYAVKASGPAAPFHAWISHASHILDFTTWTLSAKAKALDALDGGKTSVEWAPPFLFTPAAAAVSIDEARMAPAAGVFSYIRHPELEAAIRAHVPSPNDVQRMASAVLMAYRRMQLGAEVNFIGVNDDGSFQSGPPRHELVQVA
jgi:hypothetical protein